MRVLEDCSIALRHQDPLQRGPTKYEEPAYVPVFLCPVASDSWLMQRFWIAHSQFCSISSAPPSRRPFALVRNAAERIDRPRARQGAGGGRQQGWRRAPDAQCQRRTPYLKSPYSASIMSTIPAANTIGASG